MGDTLHFYLRYRTFNESYTHSPRTSEETASFLAHVIERCEVSGCELLGVNLSHLQHTARMLGEKNDRHFGRTCVALKRSSTPFEESLLLSFIAQECGIPLTVRLSDIPSSVSFPSKASQKEGVGFAGSYKGWVVIKKTSADSHTPPEAIALGCASISTSLRTKAFELLGVSVHALASQAEAITKGLRKSYAAIGTVYEKVQSLSLSPLEKRYLLLHCLLLLKFTPFLSPEEIVSVYPDLKPPSFGRFGSKKRAC